MRNHAFLTAPAYWLALVVVLPAYIGAEEANESRRELGVNKVVGNNTHISTFQKAAQSSRGVSAVQKVIDMLVDMQAKVAKDKANEQIAFAKFEAWCKEEPKNLKDDIAKADEQIQLLTAEIDKLDEDAANLADAITKLNLNVATFEADAKQATAQRKKDHAAFVAESKDYAESIEALDKAVATLEKQQYENTGAQLIELSKTGRIPLKVKKLVATFMGMMTDDDDSDEDSSSLEAPQASAYDFQSGGVLDMLKKLKEDFQAKLTECQQGERNAKAAYDMIMVDLTSSITNAKTDISEKTAEKERKLEKAAQDKKEKATTSTERAADMKTLDDLNIECREKELSFIEKQRLRTDEVEAISKAVDVLNAPSVSGASSKVALSQSPASGTLLQVNRKNDITARNAGIRHRVRKFLLTEGQRLNSNHLEFIATKLIASPLGDVGEMLDDMIARLEKKVGKDAEQEVTCNKETAKSKITRTKLSGEVDSLTAAVEDGKATIMMFTKKIKTLSSEIAKLETLMKESTDMRKQEAEKNEANIEEAQAAAKAVATAAAVLKEFYRKAASATAFVQTADDSKMETQKDAGIKWGSDEWKALANPAFKGTIDKGHKKGMQTFGDAYRGQQDYAGTIMAFLETIQSDFENLLSDTEAAELESKTTYKDLMVKSARSKAVKVKSVELNSDDKAEASAKLEEDTADLKSTQDQLLAADRYYERLQTQCSAMKTGKKARWSKTKEEIDSLKNAQTQLDDADDSS